MSDLKTKKVTNLEQHIKDGCKFRTVDGIEATFVETKKNSEHGDYHCFNVKNQFWYYNNDGKARVNRDSLNLSILVRQKKYTKEEIVEIFTSHNEENDIMRFISNNFE